MPGRHSADNQMWSFMKHKKSNTTEVAVAKAGFSRATGYRINLDPGLPSQKKTLRGRRKPDAVGGLFKTDGVPMLEAHPGIRAVGLFKELLQRTPDLDPGIRRTLERRIRDWRARHGPEKAVIVCQKHVPGRLGMSDFTSMNALGITIARQPLNHMLYHFRLPWSGFGLAASGSWRRELHGAVHRAAGCALVSGRRPRSASSGHRLPAMMP